MNYSKRNNIYQVKLLFEKLSNFKKLNNIGDISKLNNNNLESDIIGSTIKFKHLKKLNSILGFHMLHIQLYNEMHDINENMFNSLLSDSFSDDEVQSILTFIENIYSK